MFGFRRSPSPASSPANSKAYSPYDIEPDKEPKITPERRTFSEPTPLNPNRWNPFDDDEDEEEHGGRPTSTSRTGNAGKTNQFDSMSVQEVEGHAVIRAEETTNSVNTCLRIAEDIRQDATRTLETLHHQGEQITRTHMMAVDIDRDLSRGEKLLSSLGGMFSKPWKPKWTREITGPIASHEDNTRNPASKDQRENLGLAPAFKGRSRAPPLEPTNAMQKIEFERAKQDDALSDLSNLLGELKFMATDMGCELDRQNKALGHVSDDVDELNTRVKGANQRAHQLLRK